MNRGGRRGLLLALLQGALLLSLGGQLLLDRATRPRGWMLTEPVDPSLPIRGRYVNLQLLVPAPAGAMASETRRVVERVVLRSEAGLVQASLAREGTPRSRTLEAGPRSRPWDQGAPIRTSEPEAYWRLGPSVAFFLSPQVPDPSVRPPGEELWVEVTLPAAGPPRPIRLGVKRGDGAIRPLDLH